MQGQEWGTEVGTPPVEVGTPLAEVGMPLVGENMPLAEVGMSLAEVGMPLAEVGMPLVGEDRVLPGVGNPRTRHNLVVVDLCWGRTLLFPRNM